MKTLSWVKCAFTLMVSTGALAQVPANAVLVNGMNSLRMVVEKEALPRRIRVQASETLTAIVDEIGQAEVQRLLPWSETPTASILEASAELNRGLILDASLVAVERQEAVERLVGLVTRCPGLQPWLPTANDVEAGAVRERLAQRRRNLATGLRWRSETGQLRR